MGDFAIGGSSGMHSVHSVRSAPHGDQRPDLQERRSTSLPQVRAPVTSPAPERPEKSNKKLNKFLNMKKKNEKFFLN